MKLEVFRREAPERWDQEVLGCPGGGVFQTTRWAALATEVSGAEPIYVRPPGAGGYCLLLRTGHLSDRLRRRRLTQPLVALALRLFPVVEARGGPCFPDGTSAEEKADFIEQIWGLGSDVGADSVTLQSPVGFDVLGDSGSDTRRGITTRRQATLLVDLQDDFGSGMHRSVMKNVRKCQRQDVTVDIVESSSLGEWFEVYQDFRRRRGLPGFSREHFDAHIKHFGDWRLHFAARWRGEMIAVMAVLACNGRLLEVELASSSVCERERLNASDMLKYEAMRWGSAHGYRQFDLAGVAVSPKNEKEAGIRRFKEKYGGVYTEFCSHTLSSGWIRRVQSLTRWLSVLVVGYKVAT